MQYYGLPECKMICTILHVTSINQQSMAAYRIQDKKIKTNSAGERILAVSVNCIFTRNLARSFYNINNTFSPASAFFSFCYNLVRLSYFFPNLSAFTYKRDVLLIWFVSQGNFHLWAMAIWTKQVYKLAKPKFLINVMTKSHPCLLLPHSVVSSDQASIHVNEQLHENLILMNTFWGTKLQLSPFDACIVVSPTSELLFRSETF